ncbi:MAG: hypothetical protein ACREQY_18670, partial [Candidatus Binatia bacterium]
AKFNSIQDIAVGPDGRVYALDLRGQDEVGNPLATVRAFWPGGKIQRFAGNNLTGPTGDGGAAAQAAIAIVPSVASLDVSPEGSLYFDEYKFNSSISQIRAVSSLVAFDPDEVTVASEDGRELYDFDEAGRHLRTRSARTNAKLLSFCYNGDGHLTAIRQLAPANAFVEDVDDCNFTSDDLVTTVEWDGAHPSAIVGPFGARTVLTVDSHGYLASVSDPLGHAHTLASTADGLLERFTPPGGGDHVFDYDALGLLERDEDPRGGYKQLARVDTSGATSIAIVSAMGRTDSKTLAPVSTGGLLRTFERVVSGSLKLVTTVTEQIGVSSVTTAPDGTQETLTYGPHDRHGLSAP